MEALFLGMNLLTSLLIGSIFWLGHFIYLSPLNKINSYTEILLFNHELKINELLVPLFIADFISLIFILLIISSALASGFIVLSIFIMIIALFLTQNFLIPALRETIKNPKENLRSRIYRYNWMRAIIWSLKTSILIIVILEWIFFSPYLKGL
jgi:hypothetical protein